MTNWYAAKSKSAPATPLGNAAKYALRCAEKNSDAATSVPPKMMVVPPVFPQNAEYAATPPDPWHMGIPPKHPESTFIHPVVFIIVFSVISAWG